MSVNRNKGSEIIYHPGADIYHHYDQIFNLVSAIISKNGHISTQVMCITLNDNEIVSVTSVPVNEEDIESTPNLIESMLRDDMLCAFVFEGWLVKKLSGKPSASQETRYVVNISIYSKSGIYKAICDHDIEDKTLVKADLVHAGQTVSANGGELIIPKIPGSN